MPLLSLIVCTIYYLPFTKHQDFVLPEYYPIMCLISQIGSTCSSNAYRWLFIKYILLWGKKCQSMITFTSKPWLKSLIQTLTNTQILFKLCRYVFKPILVEDNQRNPINNLPFEDKWSPYKWFEHMGLGQHLNFHSWNMLFRFESPHIRINSCLENLTLFLYILNSSTTKRHPS